MSLGLVACAAGLARLPTLVYQKNIKDFSCTLSCLSKGGTTTNFNLDAGATPLIWMNVEFGLALVAGSLPSMRVLLKSFPGFGSSNKTSNKTRSREWAGSYEQPAHPLNNQNRWTQKARGRNIDLDTFGSLPGESQERIVLPHPSGRI